MKVKWIYPSILLCLINWNTHLGNDHVTLLPTPQFYQYLNHRIILGSGHPEVNYILPLPVDPPIRAAMDLLSIRFEELGIQIKASETSFGQSTPRTALSIYLLPYSQYVEKTGGGEGILVDEDRQVLSATNGNGQEYVLTVRPQERSVYLIGRGSQGVLYAAATLIQVIRKEGEALTIPTVHVRDFPDFKYRMAADWLLNLEINRWSYDWGDGIEAYAKRIKRKLNLCTQYKINMVLAHGFGWGVNHFAGFAELMRELNQYARDRGIRMVTGGYGASYGMAYQSGPEYEDAPYLGKAFKNRVSYPEGRIYQCMGFAYSKDPSIDTRTLGSCRANEELNELKASELREYVAKTEPGGLYIHHEDFGGYEGSQKSWLQRCERCRKHWPNDELKAPDGGAGGLANGYRKLIEAIQGVKNPGTGYNASRDCTVILVSPVYNADSRSKQDWENVLLLWRNIGGNLPKSENVQICFREVFPLQGTTRKWVPDFNRTMSEAKLPFRIFMFFAGGGNYYLNDYPGVASPALNRSFIGSETIYNGSSGHNEEPVQLINAEYSWNTRSNGFFQDPITYEESVRLWKTYSHNDARPDEIFNPDGVLDRVCEVLYGRRAGRHVAKIYTTFALADKKETPPGMWTKLYPMAVLWRNLALDSSGWSRELDAPRTKAFLQKNDMSSTDYHRNMTTRWTKWERVTNHGIRYLDAALLEPDLKPGSRVDLEYLRRTMSVGAKFSELLASLHVFLISHDKEKEILKKSLNKKKAELEAHIYESFRTRVIDPSGGDIGSWLSTLKKIDTLLNQASATLLRKFGIQKICHLEGFVGSSQKAGLIRCAL